MRLGGQRMHATDADKMTPQQRLEEIGAIPGCRDDPVPFGVRRSS